MRVVGVVLLVYFTVAVVYQVVLLNHVIGLPMIEHGTRIDKETLMQRYSDIYQQTSQQRQNTYYLYLGSDMAENENAVLMGNKSNLVFLYCMKITAYVLFVTQGFILVRSSRRFLNYVNLFRIGKR